MNNVSSMLYSTIVRYAEGGARVTTVELPPALYEEYANDQGMPQMMRTLRIKVVSRRIEQPNFITEETK